MALELLDLDDATREHMVAELERDEADDGPYRSPRLSPDGAEAYPQLLREALSGGDDRSLEAALRSPGMLRATETYTRDGRVHYRKMTSRAPQTLAEGEFNRYYIRGLCARVCAEGGGTVEVYRARPSSWARPESEDLIGAEIDAAELLEDLRAHVGEAPTLLPDVDSGLSVRLST